MSEHIWRSLEDDRDVSDAYAARHPDAVYDAADPEWLDILFVDDDVSDDELDAILDDMGADDVVIEEDDDDRSEYVELPQMENYDDYDDFDLYDDDGYYEVEIGIDYGADT